MRGRRGTSARRRGPFRFIAIAAVAAVAALALAQGAFAAVTPTSATGGTGISADKTSASGGSSTYTTISGPSFDEGAGGEVTGDITLTAPSGFNFKAGTGTCSHGAGDGTATIGTVDTTTATCTITASSTADTYSFSGLQVIPTSGTVASGNISNGGTLKLTMAADCNTFAGELSAPGDSLVLPFSGRRRA